MPERRSRKRKKKKPLLFTLVMFLLLIGLCCWVFVWPALQRFMPSHERKDLSEWFEVSGDEVRIYLDNELVQGYMGLSVSGRVYLPLEYISDALNSGFYYNQEEQLLSYTLPAEVMDYDAESTLGGGTAFIDIDGSAYISADLLELYTNITDTPFASPDQEAKRIFLHTGGTSVPQAAVIKKTALRTSADKKSPVLEDLSKGDILIVTDHSSSWSRVVSESGIIGYVSSGHIDQDAVPDDFYYPVAYEEPEPVHVTLDESVVMGFHAIYSESDVSRLGSLYAATGGAVNVISPQFLQICSADGDLTDYTSRDYIATAHEKGLLVWASIDNVSQEGGIYDFDSGEFFGDTKKRRDFIEKLIALALDYGYDGLNLDFEGLSQASGGSYTQFFRELAVECHRNSLTLSIDNYVPYDYNDHYNISEQGKFADYVVIMCYDEHTGNDIGPVASYSYTEYGITKALESVSAEQVIAALPFYTRVWRTNDGEISSEAMGIRESLQYVSDNLISLVWDEEAGAYYGETMIGSGRIQIWLEEETSLGKKAELIRQSGIGGLAVWRLGLEPDGIWELLDLNP